MDDISPSMRVVASFALLVKRSRSETYLEHNQPSFVMEPNSDAEKADASNVEYITTPKNELRDHPKVSHLIVEKVTFTDSHCRTGIVR